MSEQQVCTGLFMNNLQQPATKTVGNKTHWSWVKHRKGVYVIIKYMSINLDMLYTEECLSPET